MVRSFIFPGENFLLFYRRLVVTKCAYLYRRVATIETVLYRRNYVYTFQQNVPASKPEKSRVWWDGHRCLRDRCGSHRVLQVSVGGGQC